MRFRHGPAALAFAAAALVATAAVAHHGWSSYDAERVMRPTAQVLESSWGSPHGAIVIAVEGQRWDVVLAPVSRMQARGLVEGDIAVGRTVTVEGYPRRDGTREIRAERITAGGKTVELRLIPPELIAAIEASALADWAGSEALVYPIANTAHVIGAVLLVGGIGLLDLRLLGYGRRLAPQTLAEVVTPLALAGFVLMMVSGALMFAADARAMAASPLFIAKLGLIGLAGLNAAVFRSLFRRLDGAIPAGARLLAAVSLALWLGVVVLGRLVAYF